MKAINEQSLHIALALGQQKKRLSEYRARLSKDKSGRLFDREAVELLKRYAWDPHQVNKILDYLYYLTNDRGDKFCRSIGHVDDIRKQLEGFCSPEKSSFRWNEHYRSAVAKVTSRYSKAKLKALQYHSDGDIYDAVTDWSTAAGYSKLVTGKAKKRDYLCNIFQNYRRSEEAALETGSFNKPIIIANRTQGSGAFNDDGSFTHTWKSKMRAVFVVDLDVVIAERKFGKPLTQWLTYYPYSAIGKDDTALHTQINVWRYSNFNWMSLDYSKYDSTIPSWLIRSAFDVLRAAFELSEGERLLTEILEEDFINKNIITDTGVVHVKKGNPSGSGLTAIINGICNEIMTETWSHAFKVRLKGYNIMGDDNLIFVESIDDLSPLLDAVSHYLDHNFGVKVNVDKSRFGTPDNDPEYLSRWWTHQGPSRDAGTIISLLAYPERPRKYRDPVAKLRPSMVLYSYILAYRPAMEKLINVPAFKMEQWVPTLQNCDWTLEQRRAIPWNVRVYVETHLMSKRMRRTLAS